MRPPFDVHAHGTDRNLAPHAAQISEVDPHIDSLSTLAIEGAANLKRMLELGDDRPTIRYLARQLSDHLSALNEVKVTNGFARTPAPDPTLAQAREIVHFLADARALAKKIDDFHYFYRDNPKVAAFFAVSPSVKRACHKADRLASAIARGAQRTRLTNAGRPVTSSAVALRLIYGAARILPAASRSRYQGEFESELHELSAVSSRWAQVMFGLRLLDRAWILRAELQRASRQKNTVRL